MEHPVKTLTNNFAERENGRHDSDAREEFQFGRSALEGDQGQQPGAHGKVSPCRRASHPPMDNTPGKGKAA
jgi:hypothetical protein